jgi:hypothetical protein
MEIEKKIFGLRERLGYDFFFLEERWKKMNNVLLGFISPNFSSLSLKKILMVALLFLFFFFLLALFLQFTHLVIVTPVLSFSF